MDMLRRLINSHIIIHIHYIYITLHYILYSCIGYIVGLLSCLWYAVWLVVARRNMSQHPWISLDEKQHILKSSSLSDVNRPVCRLRLCVSSLTYTHYITRSKNRRHESTPFPDAPFFVPVPYATGTGMKISGAVNKRVKVIWYSVQCRALHWTDNKNFDL